MKLAQILPLLLLLSGCHLLFPYDPAEDAGVSGDGPHTGDVTFDGLHLEGPRITLDGGGCAFGSGVPLLYSRFTTNQSWLFQAHCKNSHVAFGQCANTACVSVQDKYLSKSFSSESIPTFTLGMRFRMPKNPACDVLLFRLGTQLGADPELDLEHGLRLMIHRGDKDQPELRVVIRSKGNWWSGLVRIAGIKADAWHTIELRGREYYGYMLLDYLLTAPDGKTAHRSNVLTYQRMKNLNAYQFGSLSKDCCMAHIDYDWVCFVNQY